jgi:trimethylamine:corrinoid methyltransferase-like protein
MNSAKLDAAGADVDGERVRIPPRIMADAIGAAPSYLTPGNEMDGRRPFANTDDRVKAAITG